MIQWKRSFQIVPFAGSLALLLYLAMPQPADAQAPSKSTKKPAAADKGGSRTATTSGLAGASTQAPPLIPGSKNRPDGGSPGFMTLDPSIDAFGNYSGGGGPSIGFSFGTGRW